MSAVKVEWNILGTVLSTSGGEDGKVRVWKRELLFVSALWLLWGQHDHPWPPLSEHYPR